MQFVPHFALTLKANGRERVLRTSIKVSLPTSSATEMAARWEGAKEYQGIWDTGASNSVITKRIISELDLKPIGVAEVCHAQGKTIANRYLVNIILPNTVVIPALTVTEGVLSGMDVLIGMDVITAGDFSVTNKNGKTTMSFRIPSCKEIDYVPESEQFNAVMQNGSRKLKDHYRSLYS